MTDWQTIFLIGLAGIVVASVGPHLVGERSRGWLG